VRRCACGSYKVTRTLDGGDKRYTCRSCDATWLEQSPFAAMREAADRGWQEGQLERQRQQELAQPANATELAHG